MNKVFNIEEGIQAELDVTSFKKGELIAIGGRAGSGKTDLALSTIAQSLLNEDSVLLFSTELDVTEIKRRLVCKLTPKESQKRNDKKDLSDEELKTIKKANELISYSSRFTMDLRQNLTTEQIVEAIEQRKIGSLSGLDIVIIDHFKAPVVKGESLEETTTKMLNTLKDVAFKYNIVVVTFFQLNSLYQNDNIRPQMSGIDKVLTLV